MRSSPMALVATVIVLGLWPLAARAYDCGFYNYAGASVGRHCASTTQTPPPQRVTAVCRDKSYSYDQGTEACLAHGGVQIWLR
jgi:hypothetical protein